MNFQSRITPEIQLDGVEPSKSESFIGATSFVDFFCGGGLVRHGLQPHWNCQLAVDWDKIKQRSYEKRWNDDVFHCADVGSVDPRLLSNNLGLLWSSFPCQDLSLAGTRSGLAGERSGHFWSVIDKVRCAKSFGTPPKILAFENVPGFVSQNDGKDVAQAINAIADLGYRCTVVVIDAKLFVPQSRPRVFLLGYRADLNPRIGVRQDGNNWLYPQFLRRCIDRHGLAERSDWFWFDAREPKRKVKTLSEIMDWNAQRSAWDTSDQTNRLIAMLGDKHAEKLKKLIASKKKSVFGLYRRMRSENGRNIQRAEISFNTYAGCLRAPTGGSSRQRFLFVDGRRLQTRLALPSELCEMMGTTVTPFKGMSYNEVYRVLGEGVSPPVVRFIDRNFFSKIVH